MTEIARLMHERGWTARGLSDELKCTRYLLREIMSHEPESSIQHRLADRARAVLGVKKPAMPRTVSAARAGVPLLGDIPAGPLSFKEGEVETEQWIPVSDLDPAQHFAVRIIGSSMEPDFRSRDLVLCRRVEDLALPVREEGPTPIHRLTRFDGRVVCALVDGSETSLKRLEILKTGKGETDYTIRLCPLNPNHPVISIGSDNTFAIQGEAVRLFREL